ncbi:hypothetical protein K493DRAFT_332768 [Basidiobolus meristosporus CBS 931.73]|uniref:Uncharacterized protein n=1 Tax=Basidiobolus meristosporus CBS 931.73 TaxID=1314790 RepID=A0A1Y1ZB41_9FUNG|nr:hypothetical protein K493DRAFT_332768 [Basidiobolus meristosporus CBS 931.73]|eukprot:ORY07502.1 hypothetical protein K493DRAFT_332768 [Basidiobolus meristosporus CBS 931.73]
MKTSERKFSSRRKYLWWLLAGTLCLLLVGAFRNVHYTGENTSLKPAEYSPDRPMEQDADEKLLREGTTAGVNEAQLNDLYQCYSMGSCRRCSDEESATNPYCQDTGYKEPIQCTPIEAGKHLAVVELPNYRSCSRTKYHEKLQFFKFMGFVIFLSVCSGILLVWRRRRIESEQYRRLMQRIENA